MPVWIWVGLVLVGAAVRLQPIVTTDALTSGITFFGTDPYYHLRRLVYLLENFPRTLVNDPLAVWPDGMSVDWPDGFLYLLGLPLKLFGVDSFRSLEWGASLLMVLLGLLCLLTSLRFGCHFIETRGARLFLGLTLALNFLLMRYSVIGELDHHVVECLFAPVAMLFAWRLDLVGPRRAALFGLATALMVWISSSAVFVWAGLALLFSFRELRADRLKKFLSFGLAGAAMLALLAGINGVLGRPVWSVAQPSAFHVLIWCGLWSVVSLRALRLSLGPLIIAIGCICAGLLVIADFRAHFWAAWSYIFNPQGMLESVLETKSPLFEGDQFVTGYIHLNLGYLGWLLVLAPLLLLLWRRFTGAQRDLLIMVLTLWPFALAQSRFLHLVVPVFLIGLAAILDRITGSMHQRGIRFSRAVVVGFGILTIAPAFSVGFRLDHHESDFRDLKAARTVASALGITPDLRWQRLALRVMPQTGVFVGPDQGHILSYMTGLGVTANSFNHGWAGQQRIFLQASSAEEFKQVAFKARVEYAFLSNDVSAFERQRRAFGLGEVSRMDLPNFGFFEILHRKPASFETVAEDYGLYQGQTVLKWKFVKF